MSLERYYGYLKSKRDGQAALLAQDAARLFAEGRSGEGMEKSQQVLEIGRASSTEQALGAKHIEERQQLGLADLTITEFVEIALTDPRNAVDIRPLFENPDFVRSLITQIPARLLQGSLPEVKHEVQEQARVAEKLPERRSIAPEAKFVLPDGKEAIGMVAKVLGELDPFSPEPKDISRKDLTTRVYGVYTPENAKKLSAIVSKARPVLADWGRNIDCINYSRGHHPGTHRGTLLL